MDSSVSFWVFYLAVAFAGLAGLAMVFSKLSVAWWKAFVPFYNSWVLSELIFGKGVYAVFLFIPFVNIFASIVFFWKLGEKFGKSALFKIGLFVAPFIFLIVLGAGASRPVTDRRGDDVAVLE